MKMSKLSIIEGRGPLGEDLEEVSTKPLELKETLEALFEGKVILLTTYEDTRDKDILVRLKDTKNGQVTQVSNTSSAMSGFVGSKNYWSLHDVTINMLSMYPTYIYDPAAYNIGYRYSPNTIVEHTSSHGDLDVAVITKILTDEECNFYYKLSGEGDRLYREEELTALKD